MDVDTVVIGSGAGGLAAALALAQSGQRVIVLEQHYLPGGWCHSFTLGEQKYRFNPGVHYVGEMHPGGLMRRVYEGLGLGDDLTFMELNPDGVDHAVFAREGVRFDFPKGKDRVIDRLSARFPRERHGIRAYFDTVERLASELQQTVQIQSAGALLDAAIKRQPLPRSLARWGMSTAGAMIDGRVKDPVLRGLLATQCGNHGLPPSLVSAPVHASVVAHYFDGAFYPKGGASTIPRAFIRALRRAGSDIRVRARVRKILVENRKAIGVVLEDGVEIRARQVISNADPDITFRQLVGVQHLSSGLRAKMERTRWSLSALSLFMAVDMDVRAAGMDSGTVWSYPSCDVEGAYRLGNTPWGAGVGELPGMFTTCTTLKDPAKLRSTGHHTIESFTFVSYEAYRAWENSRLDARPAAYTSLKAEITRKMIGNLDSIFPDLGKHVVFSALGTPLTNAHYCAATRGNLFGTEKSRWQMWPWAHQTRTEIGQLYLCGASVTMHSVLGATMSGLLAAREILGGRVDDLLRQRSRAIPILQAEDLASS